jgi:hypothetical protein
MAHELAHVVQQQRIASAPVIQRDGGKPIRPTCTVEQSSVDIVSIQGIPYAKISSLTTGLRHKGGKKDAFGEIPASELRNQNRPGVSLFYNVVLEYENPQDDLTITFLSGKKDLETRVFPSVNISVIPKGDQSEPEEEKPPKIDVEGQQQKVADSYTAQAMALTKTLNPLWRAAKELEFTPLARVAAGGFGAMFGTGEHVVRLGLDTIDSVGDLASPSSHIKSVVDLARGKPLREVGPVKDAREKVDEAKAIGRQASETWDIASGKTNAIYEKTKPVFAKFERARSAFFEARDGYNKSRDYADGGKYLGMMESALNDMKATAADYQTLCQELGVLKQAQRVDELSEASVTGMQQAPITEFRALMTVEMAGELRGSMKPPLGELPGELPGGATPKIPVGETPPALPAGELPPPAEIPAGELPPAPKVPGELPPAPEIPAGELPPAPKVPSELPPVPEAPGELPPASTPRESGVYPKYDPAGQPPSQPQVMQRPVAVGESPRPKGPDLRVVEGGQGKGAAGDVPVNVKPNEAGAAPKPKLVEPPSNSPPGGKPPPTGEQPAAARGPYDRRRAELAARENAATGGPSAGTKPAPSPGEGPRPAEPTTLEPPKSETPLLDELLKDDPAKTPATEPPKSDTPLLDQLLKDEEAKPPVSSPPASGAKPSSPAAGPRPAEPGALEPAKSPTPAPVAPRPVTKGVSGPATMTPEQAARVAKVVRRTEGAAAARPPSLRQGSATVDRAALSNYLDANQAQIEQAVKRLEDCKTPDDVNKQSATAPEPKATRVPSSDDRAAKVERAEKLGTERGRQYAVDKLGLKDAGYVNPEEGHGKFGRGIDDIVVDSKGEPHINEYKGEDSKLDPGTETRAPQMSSEWVRNNLERLVEKGGPVTKQLAQKALKLLAEGKLKGHVIRTRIKDGNIETSEDGGEITFTPEPDGKTPKKDKP